MKKNNILIILLLIVLSILSIASLLLGQYPISLESFYGYLSYKLFDGTFVDEYIMIENIIFEIRMPRLIAALLVGASLAVSGAAFQAMFINPLVSPGILGVLAGASFGAAVGMLLSTSTLVIQLSAFTFGFLAVGVSLFIASMVSHNRSTIILVLGGVVSASLFGALLSMVKYVADPYDTLPAIVYWLMGSLSNASYSEIVYLAPMMGLSILSLIFMSKYFDILSLGDEEAKALGLNVSLIRFIAIFLATLISSLAVVISGIIGWVGLVIPHIIRMSIGPSHRMLIPLSVIVGAIFLLVADSVSRLAFSVEIPIGIITSIIGIPIFVIVLKNARSAWN